MYSIEADGRARCRFNFKNSKSFWSVDFPDDGAAEIG